MNRLANGTRDSLGGGDTAQMAGNVAANILAGGIGGLIGGGTGATTGSNVDFYNRSTGNGDGQGSTANSAVSWLADQFASAGRGAANMGNQFAALVNANGAQGPYLDPNDLNGPGGNSKPPATGGSAIPVVVCVPPVCTVAVAPTPGMPGYVPSNATFNSGNGDGQSASSSLNGVTNNSGSLENAERAVVDPRKITGYVLDPDHPVGGNKARVFESALGFNQSNADGLISQIQDGVTKYQATPGKVDQYGQRFTVDIPVTGPNGNIVQVRTGWIYEPGSSTPRLTTMFVK